MYIALGDSLAAARGDGHQPAGLGAQRGQVQPGARAGGEGSGDHVLDPAHAPGTGTPEAGGMTSRELLEIVRGLRGLDLVGADVVEVSPAYDHAELTGVAAAHVAYDLIGLMTDLRASREGAA